LAALGKRFSHLTVITQNVDNLHEQAGTTNIIHLHGNLAQSKCFYNCKGNPTIVDVTKIDWDRTSGPPPCPYCGRWVRPDVVWFGEILPAEALQGAITLSQMCDVMIVVGTSGLVSPAADLPGVAKQSGAVIIEVNPDYSAITRLVDVRLPGASGELLPLVVEALDRV
jgi:NAD-dependent deacetylase